MMTYYENSASIDHSPSNLPETRNPPYSYFLEMLTERALEQNDAINGEEQMSKKFLHIIAG